MTIRKRLTAFTAVLSLVLLGFGAVDTARAAPIADGYYVLGYNGAVYQVSSSGSSVRHISYQEWAAAGFPTPQPAPTDYVKYSWAPTISAVTYFDPEDPSSWLWEPLSLQSWQNAGKPQPRDVAYVGGSYFYQWGTSSQILVEEPGGVRHVLTYPEWADSGFQPFDARRNEGFLKLSWTSSIARMSDLARGRGTPITYAQWSEQGFPAPRVVNRVSGDQFYREYTSPTIWYAGPTENRPITYAEWTLAGFPPPLVINVPPSYVVPNHWRGVDLERIPTNQKVVALTFDAGASDAGTRSILDTLVRYDVDATFFITGAFARSYPGAVQGMVLGGHPVGNHSNTHPEFPALTDAQIVAELAAADASIKAAGGRGTRPLFRFPFGARTAADIAVVNDAGYVPFRWTVDSLGWQGTSGGRSVASVRDRVLAAATPGGIVLMHVGAHPTDRSTLDADALPQIIEGLRGQGYGFVTLSSLIP
ncbi:polysaccharide deacetylase family protein [Arthrobacter sp. R1-13]